MITSPPIESQVLLVHYMFYYCIRVPSFLEGSPQKQFILVPLVYQPSFFKDFGELKLIADISLYIYFVIQNIRGE